jgi:hypothetical protein
MEILIKQSMGNADILLQLTVLENGENRMTICGGNTGFSTLLSV